MSRGLGLVSLLVRDYDEAIAFFTAALDFEVREDAPAGPAKRWVVVAPRGGPGAALLLARAATPQQHACIGNQAGGRVFLFLEVEDLDAAVARMRAHDVRFLESPREESYGRVVQFLDLYGNKWDLIERRSGT